MNSKLAPKILSPDKTQFIIHEFHLQKPANKGDLCWKGVARFSVTAFILTYALKNFFLDFIPEEILLFTEKGKAVSLQCFLDPLMIVYNSLMTPNDVAAWTCLVLNIAI